MIADFCKSLGLIEKYGSGIGRIVDYFKAENLPIPEFRNISDGFMVTIFGKEVDDVTEKVTDKLGDKLGDNQQLILAAIMHDSKISLSQLSKVVGISQTAIEKNMTNLKKSGIIKRIGPAKGGYWQIVQ